MCLRHLIRRLSPWGPQWRVMSGIVTSEATITQSLSQLRGMLAEVWVSLHAGCSLPSHRLESVPRLRCPSVCKRWSRQPTECSSATAPHWTCSTISRCCAMVLILDNPGVPAAPFIMSNMIQKRLLRNCSSPRVRVHSDQLFSALLFVRP